MFRTCVRCGLLLCAIGLAGSCARVPRMTHVPRPPVQHVVPVFVFPSETTTCALSTYPLVRVRLKDTIVWEVVELTEACTQKGQDLVIIGFEAAANCAVMDGLVPKGKGKRQQATVHNKNDYKLPLSCKYEIKYGKYGIDPEVEIDKP